MEIQGCLTGVTVQNQASKKKILRMRPIKKMLASNFVLNQIFNVGHWVGGSQEFAHGSDGKW